MDIQKDLIENFMREVEDREQRKIMLSREERLAAEKKGKDLQPVRDLLQKFVDMGIYVKNENYYNRNIQKNNLPDENGKEFLIYEVDSSVSWAPGVSIWFDHPAQVEIAIPNKKEEGVVVISVGSDHPDAYIIEKKYFDMKAACEALTRFLAKNTISVKNDPRKINEDRKTTPPGHFFSASPMQPPTDKIQHINNSIDNQNNNSKTNPKEMKISNHGTSNTNNLTNNPKANNTTNHVTGNITGPYNPIKNQNINDDDNVKKDTQKPFSLKNLDSLIERNGKITGKITD